MLLVENTANGVEAHSLVVHGNSGSDLSSGSSLSRLRAVVCKLTPAIFTPPPLDATEMPVLDYVLRVALLALHFLVADGHWNLPLQRFPDSEPVTLTSDEIRATIGNLLALLYH